MLQCSTYCIFGFVSLVTRSTRKHCTHERKQKTNILVFLETECKKTKQYSGTLGSRVSKANMKNPTETKKCEYSLTMQLTAKEIQNIGVFVCVFMLSVDVFCVFLFAQFSAVCGILVPIVPEHWYVLFFLAVFAHSFDLLIL